jgi:hypothetical protein
VAQPASKISAPQTINPANLNTRPLCETKKRTQAVSRQKPIIFIFVLILILNQPGLDRQQMAGGRIHAWSLAGPCGRAARLVFPQSNPADPQVRPTHLLFIARTVCGCAHGGRMIRRRLVCGGELRHALAK